jgi:hypothetical protein
MLTVAADTAAELRAVIRREIFMKFDDVCESVADNLKKTIAVNENHPRCDLTSLMQIRPSFKCSFKQ